MFCFQIQLSFLIFVKFKAANSSDLSKNVYVNSSPRNSWWTASLEFSDAKAWYISYQGSLIGSQIINGLLTKVKVKFLHVLNSQGNQQVGQLTFIPLFSIYTIYISIYLQLNAEILIFRGLLFRGANTSNIDNSNEDKLHC